MIPVVLPAPKNGGSARGCTRYILGYAATEKELSKQEAWRQLQGLYAGTDARADRGVGPLIELSGIRPAGVWAHGVTSLSTADLEMDSLVAANSRTTEPIMHMVLSFGSDRDISNAQMQQAVDGVLAKVGLDHFQYVAAIHRDTDDPHVHLAVSRVDPRSLRCYDRTQFNNRLHKAAREIEIELRLARDFGNYRTIEENGIAKVIQTNREQRAVHRAETAAKRRGERRSRAKTAEQVEAFERDFERFADTTTAPRVRQALERCDEYHETRSWNEAHRVALLHGATFEKRNGVLYLREVSKDSEGREVTAERVGLTPADLKLGPFEDVDQAQSKYVDYLKTNPQVIIAGVAYREQLFSVDTIDAHLAARIDDFNDFDDLRELVLRVPALVTLTEDDDLPLLTTEGAITVERECAELARELAGTRDPHFDRTILSRAFSEMQIRRGFRLTQEQRQAIEKIERRLLTIEGRSGVGKTTLMDVARRYGDLAGREIIGLTLSAAAAERLQIEAGFRCVNTALAKALEQRGDAVIPENGIVVIDEAGMIDVDTMAKLMRLAERRHCTVLAIGDRRQLQPIAAGNGFALLISETQRLGQHAEVLEIRRQSGWYKEAVQALSDGIEHRNGRLAEQALAVMEQHDALVFSATQADTVRDSVRSYVKHKKRGHELIIIGVTREQVRWVNESARKELGLDSKRGAFTYSTEGGDRRLVAGDRIVFQRNDARLGVLNGYLGDVLQVERYRITVRTFDGKTVAFDPRRYTRWDYGHAAITIHKSQGASLYGAEHLPTRAVSAESFHVATSRGQGYLKVRIAREHFADLEDVADHLGRSFSRKLNVHDYSALQSESKKGEELRRIYTERRARSDEQPAVIHYQAYLDSLNTRKTVALLEIAQRYDKPRAEIRQSLPPDGARAEALHRLMREKRRAETGIVEEFKPLAFDAWRAQEHREILGELHRADRMREQMRELQSEHEYENHGPARGPAIERHYLAATPVKGRAGKSFSGKILSVDREAGLVRQLVTIRNVGHETAQVIEHQLPLISGRLEEGVILTLRYDSTAQAITVGRARGCDSMREL